MERPELFSPETTLTRGYVGNARLDSSRMQPLIRLKDGLHIAGPVAAFCGEIRR